MLSNAAAASLRRRTFGTYRKSGPLLQVAIRQAIGEAEDHIFLVDTARSYGNQPEIAAIMKEYPWVRVGSKVNRGAPVAEQLAEMESLFGSSLYRVLLHRPMPLGDWRVLQQAKQQGRVKEIGVCNYSAEELANLMSVCELPPDVVQNELHPCIATPVLELCKKHGIRFEAHSVMAANEYLSACAQRLRVSPAEVAIAFCLAQGADVCFSTENLAHLRQDISPGLENLLTEDDVAELMLLAFQHPIRIYRSQGSLTADVDAVYDGLVKDIRCFQDGKPFSDLCRSIPKTFRGTQSAQTKLMAERFFPKAPSPGCWQKFDALLHRMRKALEARDEKVRAERRAAARFKVCSLPREAVAFPAALPVDIPSADCFKPFLEELKALTSKGLQGSLYPRRLERGTLFPDGRMDLCKQVIQPCFPELCQAVAVSASVKHFLLGNNVVFRDGTSEEIKVRADAFLTLLRSDPPIETWYLAGNGIDALLSEALAKGFWTATHLKALWLKMNPVKTGARYFGELAIVNTGLELLDLFNTGLGNDGVQAFRDGLAPHGSQNLKHLYLSINDISDGSAIADVIRLLPHLESLFLGVNFLGDEGAAFVLAALVGHPTLQRLEMGANGLTDKSLPLILKVAASTSLDSITLGSYKSTRFFDGQANSFSDVVLLAQVGRHVQHLSLDGGIEGVNIDQLDEALQQENPDICVYASQGAVGSKRVLSRGGDEAVDKRRLAHPQPYVDNIQSIYRNQM